MLREWILGVCQSQYEEPIQAIMCDHIWPALATEYRAITRTQPGTAVARAHCMRSGLTCSSPLVGNIDDHVLHA